MATHFFALGARNGFPSYYKEAAKFLDLQNQGIDAETAYAQSFSVSIEELYDEIKRYARNKQRRGITLEKPQVDLLPKIEALSSIQVKSLLSALYGWSDKEAKGYEYLVEAATANDPFAKSIRAIQLARDGETDASLANIAALSDKKGLTYDVEYNIAYSYKILSTRAASKSDAKTFREKSKHHLDASLAQADYVPTLIELTKYHVNFSTKTEAIDAANKLLAIAPNHPAARIIAAQAFLKFQQLEFAKESLEAGLRLTSHQEKTQKHIQSLLDLIQ